MRDTVPPATDVRIPGAHPADAELIRLLDAESALGPIIAGEAGTHVARCPECSARLSLLRARSASLSALLRATDPPTPDAERLRPPARRLAARPTRHLRVAAALILCTAAIAAASNPTIRGWAALQVASRGEPASHRPAPGPLAPPEGGPTAIRFPTEGAELTVTFDEPQTAGALELTASDDDLAMAEVMGGTGVELVVLPSALHVRNGRASAARYRIGLPPNVSVVTVHVGRESARRILRSAIVRDTTVPVSLRPR